MKVFKVEQSIQTYRRKYKKKSDNNGEPTPRKRGLAFKPAVKQSVKRHYVKTKTESKVGK